MIPALIYLSTWATAVMLSPDLQTDTVCAAVPLLPAGGGTITNKITKSASKSKSLRRPYIRKGVRSAVESKARKGKGRSRRFNSKAV